MIADILDSPNYIRPNITEIESENCQIKLDDENTTSLWINNESWMIDTSDYMSWYQLLPDYDLAYGDCVCTGMGMLIRESLLLSKPEVKTVTVVEISKDLIDLQKKLNPELMNHPKLKIVNCDANEYKGKCDFLSIDHYEDIDDKERHETIQTVMDNVEHKVSWYWKLLEESSTYTLYNIIKKAYNTLPNLSKLKLEEYLKLNQPLEG
jgi:hypothetical protein